MMIFLGLLSVLLCILYIRKEYNRKEYVKEKMNIGYREVYIMFLDGSGKYGMLTEGFLRLYENQEYRKLDFINFLDYNNNIKRYDLKDIHFIERR